MDYDRRGHKGLEDIFIYKASRATIQGESEASINPETLVINRQAQIALKTQKLPLIFWSDGPANNENQSRYICYLAGTPVYLVLKRRYETLDQRRDYHEKMPDWWRELDERKYTRAFGIKDRRHYKWFLSLHISEYRIKSWYAYSRNCVIDEFVGERDFKGFSFLYNQSSAQWLSLKRITRAVFIHFDDDDTFMKPEVGRNGRTPYLLRPSNSVFFWEQESFDTIEQECTKILKKFLEKWNAARLKHPGMLREFNFTQE